MIDKLPVSRSRPNIISRHKDKLVRIDFISQGIVSKGFFGASSETDYPPRSAANRYYTPSTA